MVVVAGKLSFLLILSAFLVSLFSALSFATMDQCWLYDNNQTACNNAISSGMGCLWSPKATDPWCAAATGCCIMQGCWNFDQTEESSCEQDASCDWKPNDKNQNPWCWNNVGCCDKKGCWNYINTNESACESAFGGICQWTAAGAGNFCPEPVGCCSPGWCGNYNESQCAKAPLYDMPCNWNNATESCEDQGFNFFSGENDCTIGGGWWNSGTETCEMPTFNADIRCWFASGGNQAVCGNVTGCVYCNSSNVESNTSFCYNAAPGDCRGHEPKPYSDSSGAAEDNIVCTDILIEKICNCGPLPGCKWNGTGCAEGMLTQAEKNQCAPPVQFCEETSNQTVCESLVSQYFMPCEWDNSTSKCKFKSSMVFGGGGTGSFMEIQDENSCAMAGGVWKSESYVDGGVVKIENWCEMGSGVGFQMCDDSCWACEFQPDGSQWANAAAAQTACQNSELGFCQWMPDTHAFNDQGWCDFPHDFSFGGGDCNSDCKNCNFMIDPEAECESSDASCKWTGSECISQTKKSCDESCFSCYDPATCGTSDAGCGWDNIMQYCKPVGFNGEVCFDGIDNNGNGMWDCGDPDCGFDEFCGGGFMGAEFSTCKMLNSELECEAAETPMGNCDWINNTFSAYCDMPGASCWESDDNQSACEADTACRWMNLTAEGKEPDCDTNMTAEDLCNGMNQSACGENAVCAWRTDFTGNGWCEYYLFGCFGKSQTSCEADSNCSWTSDSHSFEGGWCDPFCFSLNQSECAAEPSCEVLETFCDPGYAMNDCPSYDGNETACAAHNMSCFWQAGADAPEPDNGWCNNVGMQAMFQGMDPSPPIHLGDDEQDADVAEEVDIRFFGIKDMGNSFGFGAGVTNLEGAAICNGFPLQTGGSGDGHNTTKFFFYIDTNENEIDGCAAKDEDGETVPGFEFLLKNIGEWNNNENESAETLTFHSCVNSSWVSTNVPVSQWKQMMCGDIGGAMAAVEKESLEKFSSYNKSKTMRIFVTSADASHNSSAPVDSVGPSYYTPGSVDFKFECCDCPGQDIDGDGFNSETDPDCKFVKKFGYMPFEDCWNSADDDGDGAVDCDDVQCSQTPKCGGSFAFATDANDKKAPKVTFSKKDAFVDGAFIVFDTDEPANGSVLFYRNDSSCATLNKTINDVGDPFFTFDDFKPFHGVPVDNFQFNPNKLGYSLQNGTAYYYKLQTCDPSGNCAYSACSNFTTAAAYSDFVFKMNMPPGFKVNIPQLGMTNDNFTYGKKSNATTANNMNITVDCEAEGYSLTFVGADVMKAKTLDLENAFVCDSDDGLIGMASDDWHKLLQELGVDYVILTIPAENGDALMHCDDNGENCEDVTDYADCEFGVTETVCKIPVTLGFSTYKVDSPDDGGGERSRGSTTASSGAAQTTTSCTQLWDCAGWSNCTGGFQARLCVDFNDCDNRYKKGNASSVITSQKPAESQRCEMPAAVEQVEAAEMPSPTSPAPSPITGAATTGLAGLALTQTQLVVVMAAMLAVGLIVIYARSRRR